MKEAGCFYLSFGFESNSPNTLRLIKKKAAPQDNERAVEICKRLGILCNSAFLFGIPGETEEDLADTLKFVEKYNIFSTGVNVMKPLPGSPFYDQFINEGILKKSVEDWHRISSIHHDSGYFNDRISCEIYEEYKKKFQRIIWLKSRINHYCVNWRNLLRYRYTVQSLS